MKDIKILVYSALLTALAIVIPIAFGFLSIQVGPFSATLASHVPLFLAILLGPAPAAMVGIGSGIGFLLTKGSYIAARAFMHTFVGVAGAILIKSGVGYSKMVAITAPLHGILEALVVIPFGINLDKILITVGIGSSLHHIVDGIIAFAVVQALSKALNLKLIKSA
ncbi:Niacin transporter NiaX [Clostridium liquoris]|jgi:niacin transporter|uniref:Niacin transporter NiaX n=1 Tax=Clostridium liquoris TaxID=1289519 RepID=A0A2T0B2W5_9CLOT|nr:ECF transporter S component [Clostridium liquoris]PRR78153.1 Niacin transporter NiaX [Clostridium liquoris]